MEAIIIGIAVDIGLGLLFLIGKKIFLSIRDYYRHSNGIFLKNSTEKDTPTVDKKEIDDEVQKAVENLVPTLAAKITMLGRDYSGKDKAFDQLMNRESHKVRLSKESLPRWAAERQMIESSNPWATNESYTGFTGACGITMQDISASTPNSSKAPLDFEKFIRSIADSNHATPKDKKLCESIIDGYKTAMDDKPKKVAEAFQAHLDYVNDVIKCMEEWGEMPVPSHIRTKMVNAESVDDLLDAEDEYHKMVSAHFRGKKEKYLMDMRDRIAHVERDEQPFMLTESYGGGGEIDREILASSAFDACPPMFEAPPW